MADDSRFTELEGPDAAPARSDQFPATDDAPASDADGLDPAADPVVRAERLMLRGKRLKLQANAAFGANRIDDAVQFYLLALSELPERPAPPKPSVASRKGKERERDDVSPSPPEAGSVEEPVEPEIASVAEPAPPESDEIIALRATLHANLAACYVKTVCSARPQTFYALQGSAPH